VVAIEQRAQLDPNRLPRGAAYARSGAVGELTTGPSEVRARVEGRGSRPYDVRIRVRAFDDAEWARVFDAIGGQVAHTAALLDGQLPPEIATDLERAGLGLLPGAGEVGPRCSCPDDADPCKHAAAVCYLVADALDADPFVALLLRGRTREEVLAGLRSRRRELAPDVGGSPAPAAVASAPAASVGAPLPALDDEGLDARAVMATPSWAPVPAPPLPARRPGRPVAWPLDPPPQFDALRSDLIALAADAARRAWELAVGAAPDAGLSLDPDADLARRAALSLGTSDFGALVRRSGVGERELVRWALAWRHGGASGFDVLRRLWDPASEDGGGRLLTAARTALHDATGAAVRTRGNRVTAGERQLRLGRDYRWYPYARVHRRWEPAGPGDVDPVVSMARPRF
jgi:uncharacterized Zn finger protein